MPERKQKNSLRRAALRWLAFIAGILLLLVLALHILGQQIYVSGFSMEPALREGDALILDRVRYRFSMPSRGDIVVFSSRYQEGERYIKRIIALPGETLQIVNGRVYVNGEALEEPYEEAGARIGQAGLAARQIVLQEDEYFVLGDNREDSADSREPGIGNVKLSEIEGKVWLRVWPLQRIGMVR